MDSNGRAVNLSALGVDIAVCNAPSQEDLFDASIADSLSVVPSNHLPSIPETQESPREVDNAPSTQPSVVTIPSGDTAALLNTSVASIRLNGERRLVSPKAKSDLFEDHLLTNLESGDVFYSCNGIVSKNNSCILIFI